MKWSMKGQRWLIMFCLPLLVSGCAGFGKPTYGREDIDEHHLTANNSFAFQLYEEVLKEDSENNVFLSPLSVFMALSMTANGAEGETEKAMVQALQVPDLRLEDLNRSNAALLSVLKQADSVDLRIAHSLWSREGTTLKPDFLKRNETYYDARVTELDFRNSSASDTINDWVRKATEGKIEQMVDGEIDTDTFLFLINAIYFKGKWAEPFDEANTTNKDFHLPDGTTRKIPMMSQSGEFAYYKGDGFEAIRLPYSDKSVEMTLFLPDESADLSQFHEQLNAQNWQQWMSSFEVVAGQIQLPRFDLQYKTTLNDALKAMGMGVVFDPHQANFGRMISISSTDHAYIDEVKHQSFIEVNEEGTEAAAATSTKMNLVSAPVDSFQMRVDRPFFFAITDRETSAILFMGSVVDPESSS